MGMAGYQLGSSRAWGKARKISEEYMSDMNTLFDKMFLQASERDATIMDLREQLKEKQTTTPKSPRKSKHVH